MINPSFIQFRALLARHQLLQQHHHRRLARRIHDDVNQKLTLLALQLSMAALGEEPPTAWTQKCQGWNDMVVDLGKILRNISDELRPRVLDDLGLAAGLRWIANTCPDGIACTLNAPAEPVVVQPVAANELFAVCREIVTDVFAPAGVTEMAIDLDQTTALLRVQLRVLGFKPGHEPLTFQALDALSVHERLACIDGVAEVDPQPGGGFAVTLSVQNARGMVCAAA